MIKATELRKGLYFNVPRKDQCPFRIDVIEHLSDTYAKVGMNAHKYKLGEIEIAGHPLTWELKDLSPILSTEEWFDKFGFNALQEGWFGLNQFTYNIYSQELFYNGVKLCQLKYVHELQTLYFALTNEELKLNS